MVIPVEFRVPAPVPEALRERALAAAPREGEDCCPRCGADRFHLLDALLDAQSWQNRGLAASLIGGCGACKTAVAELLLRAEREPAMALPGAGESRRQKP